MDCQYAEWNNADDELHGRACGVHTRQRLISVKDSPADLTIAWYITARRLRQYPHVLHKTESAPPEMPTVIVQSTKSASELKSAFAVRRWSYAGIYFRLSPLADSTEVRIDAVFLLSLAEEAGVVVRGSGSVAI